MANDGIEVIQERIGAIDGQLEVLKPKIFDLMSPLDYETPLAYIPNNKNFPNKKLCQELIDKRNYLVTLLQEKKPTLTFTHKERIRKGLVLSGFFVGMVRDFISIFTPIISAIMHALIILGSSIAGFILQALLTLWDLVNDITNKITKQNAENETSKIITGIITLGLVIVSLLFVANVIVIAGVDSLLVTHIAFLLITAFNLYHANQTLKSIIKKEEDSKNDINKLHNQLKEAIEKKAAQKSKKTHFEWGQKLFEDKEIFTIAEKLNKANTQSEILKIQKEYTEKKITALKWCLLGAVLVILGTVLAMAFPPALPAGLVISGIGLAIFGGHFNSHRKFTEKEKNKIKEHEQEHKFEKADVLILISNTIVLTEKNSPSHMSPTTLLPTSFPTAESPKTPQEQVQRKSFISSSSTLFSPQSTPTSSPPSTPNKEKEVEFNSLNPNY